MAEVFVGRLVGEGGFIRYVAIKRMLPHLAEDARFVQMFLDEGRLAGHVSSPHVVPVLDVGRDDEGALFIVMELVRGVALHGLIVAARKGDERLVPLDVALTILSDAARGLHDAHEAVTPLGEPMALVHRDISPQNLLVGVDGRTRITDFGVARAIQRNTATVAGELKGKLGYFAPEQAKGQVDRRTDVFALGIVAWEMLVGRRLFDGDSPLERLEKVQRMPIPSARSLRPEIPAELDAVVSRALQRDPSERFQTAGELAAALRQAGVRPADADEVGAFVRATIPDALQTLEARLVRAAREDAEGPRTAELLPDGEHRTSVEHVTPLADHDLLEGTHAHDPTRVRTSVTPRLDPVPLEPEAASGRRGPVVALVAAVVLVGAGLGGAMALRAPDAPATTATARPAMEVEAPAPEATPDAPERSAEASSVTPPSSDSPTTRARGRRARAMADGEADTSLERSANEAARPAQIAHPATTTQTGQTQGGQTQRGQTQAAQTQTAQAQAAPAVQPEQAQATPTQAAQTQVNRSQTTARASGTPAPSRDTTTPPNAPAAAPAASPSRPGALRGVDAFDRGVR